MNAEQTEAERCQRAGRFWGPNRIDGPPKPQAPWNMQPGLWVGWKSDEETLLDSELRTLVVSGQDKLPRLTRDRRFVATICSPILGRTKFELGQIIADFKPLPGRSMKGKRCLLVPGSRVGCEIQVGWKDAPRCRHSSVSTGLQPSRLCAINATLNPWNNPFGPKKSLRANATDFPDLRPTHITMILAVHLRN